jgi:shikimate kinase
MKDNIAIIGFMGSGKTTVGKILAERLGFLFFDLDNLIELSEERTIKDIFKESGEDYFRDIESDIVRRIINNKKCVFACGGGVILRSENMRLITRKSDIVYLMISPSEAVKRLSGSIERPLLPDEDRYKRISDLFKKRSTLYSRYAEITVNNVGISSESAVEKILEEVND